MNLLIDAESGAKIIGPAITMGGDASLDTLVSVLRQWGVDITLRTEDGWVEVSCIVVREVWQDTSPDFGSIEVVTWNPHTDQFDGPTLVLDVDDIVGFTVL